MAHVTDGPEQFDPAEQTDVVNQLAAEPVGGLVVAAVPEVFAGPVAALARKGIPIVAVDTVPPRGSGVETYIGNDNYALGRQLADIVIARLPSDAAGTVVLGSPRPGAPSLDRRGQGIRDALAERLPKARVLGPFDTGDRPAGSVTNWRRLVPVNPDALAFLGMGAFDDPAGPGRHP